MQVMRNKFSEYFKLVSDKSSLLTALKIAFFVGLILNLINNPQLFRAFQVSEIHISRILLTFLVPFCVSLYSSVIAKSKK
jgi:hypothetical protein